MIPPLSSLWRDEEQLWRGKDETTHWGPLLYPIHTEIHPTMQGSSLDMIAESLSGD